MIKPESTDTTTENIFGDLEPSGYESKVPSQIEIKELCKDIKPSLSKFLTADPKVASKSNLLHEVSNLQPSSLPQQTKSPKGIDKSLSRVPPNKSPIHSKRIPYKQPLKPEPKPQPVEVKPEFKTMINKKSLKMVKDSKPIFSDERYNKEMAERERKKYNAQLKKK